MTPEYQIRVSQPVEDGLARYAWIIRTADSQIIGRRTVHGDLDLRTLARQYGVPYAELIWEDVPFDGPRDPPSAGADES